MEGGRGERREKKAGGEGRGEKRRQGERGSGRGKGEEGWWDKEVGKRFGVYLIKKDREKEM